MLALLDKEVVTQPEVLLVSCIAVALFVLPLWCWLWDDFIWPRITCKKIVEVEHLNDLFARDGGWDGDPAGLKKNYRTAVHIVPSDRDYSYISAMTGTVTATVDGAGSLALRSM